MNTDTRSPTGGDLLQTVYSRLKAMAERQMAGERTEHTLQATALVHEVWLQLRHRLDGLREEPARFYGAAVEAMRRILIDHARRRNADKRGGKADRLSLDLVDVAATASPDQIMGLDAAIDALEKVNPEAAEVVRLRFYAGLSEAEVGQVVGAVERTVRRRWAFARAWLFQRLVRDGSWSTEIEPK